ncbi:50S ribosomal protein L28 [Candidatus Karelsulcia muelleri]
MYKVCQITGKKNVFGKKISHSNKKSSRIFKTNILRNRIFLINKNKWINMFLSKKGLKILYKNGLYFKIIYKNISHYEKKS